MHEILKEIRKLAKEKDVIVKFKRLTGNLSGICEYWEGKITLDPQSYFRPELLSNFFHEWGHIYCFRNNLWPEYHCINPDPVIVKKIALKVERFVDRIACHELYKYDKRVRFLPSYQGNNKEITEFLVDYYDGSRDKNEGIGGNLNNKKNFKY